MHVGLVRVRVHVHVYMSVCMHMCQCTCVNVSVNGGICVSASLCVPMYYFALSFRALSFFFIDLHLCIRK